MLRARLFLLVSCFAGVLSASSALSGETGARPGTEATPLALEPHDRGGRDPVKPVPWAKPVAGPRSVA